MDRPRQVKTLPDLASMELSADKAAVVGRFISKNATLATKQRVDGYCLQRTQRQGSHAQAGHKLSKIHQTVQSIRILNTPTVSSAMGTKSYDPPTRQFTTSRTIKQNLPPVGIYPILSLMLDVVSYIRIHPRSFLRWIVFINCRVLALSFPNRAWL